jgi:hypothetical protein
MRCIDAHRCAPTAHQCAPVLRPMRRTTRTALYVRCAGAQGLVLGSVLNPSQAPRGQHPEARPVVLHHER